MLFKKKIQNYFQESFTHATPLESYPQRQDLETKQQQTDIQWYLTMDLIFISLIASDAKHLFMCLSKVSKVAQSCPTLCDPVDCM